MQNIKRYFESLGNTMLALFMSIAGGVSWEEVIFPLKETLGSPGGPGGPGDGGYARRGLGRSK